MPVAIVRIPIVDKIISWIEIIMTVAIIVIIWIYKIVNEHVITIS